MYKHELPQRIHTTMAGLPFAFEAWILHVKTRILAQKKAIVISFGIFFALIVLQWILVAYVAPALYNEIWLDTLVVNGIIVAIDGLIAAIDGILVVINTFTNGRIDVPHLLSTVSAGNIRTALSYVTECTGTSVNPFHYLQSLIRFFIGTPTCAAMRWVYNPLGPIEPLVSWTYIGSANPARGLPRAMNNCHAQFGTLSATSITVSGLVCLCLSIGWICMALWIIWIAAIIVMNRAFIHLIVEIGLVAIKFATDVGVIISNLGKR